MRDYAAIVEGYCAGVLDGSIVAGDDVINAVKRYESDLGRDDLTFDPSEPTAVLSIIEGKFCHRQGERLDGTPLMGTPLTFEPWEVFIVWCLFGFRWKDTGLVRYTEAIIEVARKNGKTLLIAFAVEVTA